MSIDPAAHTGDRVRIKIGNVPLAATEAQIRAMLLPHGTALTFERPQDEHTYRPGPVAFVEMARHEAAAAIRHLDRTRLGSATVSLTIATAWNPAIVEPYAAGNAARPRRVVTPRGMREPRRPASA